MCKNERFLRFSRPRRASDITALPMPRQTEVRTVTSSRLLPLPALKTRRLNKTNHSEQCPSVQQGPGLVRREVCRVGRGPKQKPHCVPGRLLYVFALPESSEWKHRVQIGRGWQRHTQHAVISWSFQPRTLPEQGPCLQSLRGRHKRQKKVASNALQPGQEQNGNPAVSAPQPLPPGPPSCSPARRTAHW